MLNIFKIEGYKARRFVPFYFCLALFVALSIYGAVILRSIWIW